MAAVLFDLDQTLIDSSIAEKYRKNRAWASVYPLIAQMTPYEGVSELLAMLVEKNVPVAIVTSSPRPYCTRVVAHHDFKIEKLVCYHDTSLRKPHPDPILKGIEMLGLPANEVWCIGDDPKDIHAAHAAGAHSVAVTWGAVDREALLAAGAERIFNTVAELHTFLEEIADIPSSDDNG
jgi:HAD superfamily hydrolase (TIGR01662 family)